MKVGDLVKQISWDGVGIVTYFFWYGAVRIVFPDGEYTLDCDKVEIISASR